MKQLLIPIDFSEASINAMKLGLAIAEKRNFKVTILHVYNIPPMDSQYGIPYTKDLMLSREKYINNLFIQTIESDEALKVLTQKNPFDFKLVVGVTKPVIMEELNTNAYEMVVMGNTGAGTIKQLFLGSITAEIMENANCPVLGIPAEYNIDRFARNIVIPTDFSKLSKDSIQFAKEWFKEAESNFTVLHINLSHNYVANKRMNELKTYEDYDKSQNNSKIKIDFEVLDDIYLEKGVLQYMKMYDVDLLLMCTHKRNFLRELVELSYTKQMSYYANVAVLSLPEKFLERRKSEAILWDQI